MKIISEFIICSPTLNHENISKFKQFKCANCAQARNHELYFKIANPNISQFKDILLIFKN